MEVGELNNCLSKFYLSARKQDGSHYKKTSLLSIRAALHRYLRSTPLNKKFSICDGIQFDEANKAFNSCLKYLASIGKIAATIHKNPLTTEIVQKLLKARELASADTKNPRALLQTTWFYISLYFGKRGRENQSLIKKKCFVWWLQPRVKNILSSTKKNQVRCYRQKLTRAVLMEVKITQMDKYFQAMVPKRVLFRASNHVFFIWIRVWIRYSSGPRMSLQGSIPRKIKSGLREKF